MLFAFETVYQQVNTHADFPISLGSFKFLCVHKLLTGEASGRSPLVLLQGFCNRNSTKL